MSGITDTGNIPADKLDEAVKKFEALMAQRIDAAVKASEKAAEEGLEKQVLAIFEKQETIGRADVLDIFASCKDELKIELRKQGELPRLEWVPSEDNPNIHETKGGINALYRKFGFFTTKAIDENEDVVGAPTDPGRLWTPRTGGNPFRPYVTVQQVMGDTFLIVKLNEITFRVRATSGTSIADDGASTETSHSIKTYEVLTDLSLSSDEDVPQYHPTIEEAIVRADAKLKGGLIFTAIHDSVQATAGFSEVATGVAATLPTAANIIGKTSDMLEEIGTDYRDMAVWQMSRHFEGSLQQAARANNADYAFNPALGVRMLHGYPVIVNDRMEDGNNANDVSCAFGDFGAGITLGERVDLQITTNPFTKPGAITFHARSRCAAAVNDTDAIVGMTTKT